MVFCHFVSWVLNHPGAKSLAVLKTSTGEIQNTLEGFSQSAPRQNKVTKHLLRKSFRNISVVPQFTKGHVNKKPSVCNQGSREIRAFFPAFSFQ